jgi:hypothetical protein
MNSKFADYMEFPMGLPVAGSAADPDSLGYVYIVGFSERGIVKIGSAVNMMVRLRDLQCGNPFALKLRALVSIYEGSPAIIEFAAHRLAREHHIRGEWFRLDHEEALRIVIKAARDKKAKFGAYAKAFEKNNGPQGAEADEERRRKLRIKLGME